MKRLLLVFIFILFWIIPLSTVEANQDQQVCPNRYLTLINPVRSRDLWKDKNLIHLRNQYNIIRSHNFPATWLLQYDTLNDSELIREIRNFDSIQEIGVFLEVSKSLADNARVIYAHDKPWYSPGSVFLSGYTQSERRKIIDTLFEDFKKEYGFYPKSVGAWWIDSYSLDYLKQKYRITSALIVADQKTTDHYGVWGQWWGVPYYPSKANILVPADGADSKLDVVVLQWAQRHPVLAFGEDFRSSYSLQANDYKLLNKDTEFFKELVNIYLDCRNPVGQITIGIETGMESIGFIDEYKNQLDYLRILSGIKALTMQEFAGAFKKNYPDFPRSAVIGSGKSVWDMNTERRENKTFNETIIYNKNKAFKDYFIADKAEFLDRKLDNKITKSTENNNLYIILILLITPLVLVRKKMITVWITSLMFLVAGYGLLLKSYTLYGFNIYYGPVVRNLPLVKMAVLIAIPILFFLVYKKLKDKNRLLLFICPLTFGLDVLVKNVRISWISERLYLGFLTDPLHFIGVALDKSFGLSFVNTDFPAYIAESLLKLSYNKVWENPILALLVYPLIHLLLGLVIFWILTKLPRKIQQVLLVILGLLFILHFRDLILADPRIAQQIL